MRAAPAYVEDDNHRGGWLVILTALGIAILLLCLLIRFYVRLRYNSTLRAADGVLVIAGLFAIVQSSLVFWEVSKGLGTSINLLSPQTIDLLQKSNFVATVLYLFTIYLSKCCVLCVYLHLSQEPTHLWATLSVLVLATAWMLASILTVGIDCALNEPWSDIASQCSHLFLRWQVVTGVDVTIEIMLFLLSIHLVTGTKMPLRKKSIVITAFGIRLLVIIPAVIRLHCISHQIHSSDPTLDASNTFIWTEVQLHLSIICSVTYCLRSFTSAVSTNYGSLAINLDAYEETNGIRSGYNSSRNPSKTPSTNCVDARFVGHNGKYSNNTVITAGGRPSLNRSTGTRTSGESTMVIIQEEVHVESSRVTPTRGMESEHR